MSSPIMTFSNTGPSVDDLVGNEAHVLEIGVAVGVAELPFGQVIRERRRSCCGAFRRTCSTAARNPFGQPGMSSNTTQGPFSARKIASAARPISSCQLAPRDRADLAEPLGKRQPLAQVVIGDAW